MTDRWKQISGLYHAVLKLPADERAAYLQKYAPGEDVRLEVESLLAHERTGEQLLKSPALEVAARMTANENPVLMTGRTLGHYRVEGLLGKGGMGEVYRAKDQKLGRDVAIKVLPGEFAGDSDRLARFEREAKLLASLNHPHICTIYDIDEHRGHHFIVMELIEGQTLKQHMLQQPMKVDEILPLVLEVTDGLETAHARGMIHRDIKPANIFITTTGHAKILDFGLVKLLRGPPSGQAENRASELSAETAGDHLTGNGMVVGTAAYMSPEQAMGHNLDARTDLFSLGIVLYEMATGRLPFQGDTPAAQFDSLLHKTPTSPVRINPDLPDDLEHIIDKALEKDRRLRYQDASDMRADLQRLKRDSESRPSATVEAPLQKRAARAIKQRLIVPVLAVTATLALIVSLNPWDLRNRFFGGTVTPPIESLAVLPLENLSGDPDQEAFTNGMTDTLITELSKIKALKKVISRTSIMQYKGTQKPIKQIADELGVDALIEGAALREGDKVRITVQVIDGDTDAHLWGDTFERDYKDILALHSDVARAIARQVKAALSPEEAATFAAKGTVDPEAYEYYLRGIEYGYRSESEQDQLVAVQMFETAIELDPDFAQAYARLCGVHAAIWWLGHDPTEERVARAKAALDRAVQLAPDLPETHISNAFYHFWCLLDFDTALREFEVAQKAIPNDALTWWAKGLVLRRQGKMEQSAASMRKAVELNPLLGVWAHYAGDTYAMMRNLEEANRYYDIAIENSPDRTVAYSSKAAAILNLSGDIPRARAAIEPALRLRLGNGPIIAYIRALIDLYDGHVNGAIERFPSESWESLQLWGMLLQARIYGQAMQPQLERSCYESVVEMLTPMVEKRPEEAHEAYEAYNHAFLGIAYAGLGRKYDAIREGKDAVDMMPVSKDAVAGFSQVEALARIYAMVGEYDEAIRLLEYLMSIPGTFGIGYLRLDPVWEPLRNLPGFQALLHKYGG